MAQKGSHRTSNLFEVPFLWLVPENHPCVAAVLLFFFKKVVTILTTFLDSVFVVEGLMGCIGHALSAGMLVMVEAYGQRCLCQQYFVCSFFTSGIAIVVNVDCNQVNF